MKTVSFPFFRLTLLASMLCTGAAHGQATTGSGNEVASSNPAIPKLGAVHAQAEGAAASWETSTSAAEIADRQVQNWSDLGRLIPGLDFNRSNSSVNMRGLDGNRVRILEDGIPVPWLFDGSRDVKGGLETINFNTLSSVDVVRGAGAGNATALTGTVMLRGLRPDDLLADGKDIGLLVKGTHDGLDDSIGGDMAFAARLGASTKMLIQYGIRTGSEAQNGGD
ncbi:MAG: TonB-dependent receptor plug domain-containing protein, partial [Advenella sp.]